MITREFLEQHVQRMTQQVAAFQGAIEFAEMLLKELDAPQPAIEPEMPTMTVSQLQEAIVRGQERGDSGPPSP